MGELAAGKQAERQDDIHGEMDLRLIEFDYQRCKRRLI